MTAEEKMHAAMADAARKAQEEVEAKPSDAKPSDAKPSDGDGDGDGNGELDQAEASSNPDKPPKSDKPPKRKRKRGLVTDDGKRSERDPTPAECMRGAAMRAHVPFSKAALAASQAAVELASRPLGEPQPLDFLPPTNLLDWRVQWRCECSETHRIRRLTPGIVLACDLCGRLWALEEQAVRRIGLTSRDLDALDDILVVYTHTGEELELDLVEVLDPAGERIAVQNTPRAPADLAPLLQLFEQDSDSGPFREVDHTSWHGIEMNSPDLLAALPSTFQVVYDHWTEVLDGCGCGVLWTRRRIWASDADQAVIRVDDDDRIGPLVYLTIYDDRSSYRSAFADALEDRESDESD